MAKEDWAIVVGITSYPDLGDLDGPENDANAFYDWLVDSNGGDVPKANVTRILSSNFQPPFPIGREPTVMWVQAAIQNIQAIGRQNVAANRPRRVGRRLYLYLAGHGFSPSPEQTALLMANASVLNTGAVYHVLGQYSARWFYNGAYFDEILLFMDCCREIASASSLNKGFQDEIDVDGAARCKYFYGFATRWGKNVREQPMPDGKTRGIFTTTLINGLKGGAIDPERTGDIITAQSLQGYLHENLRKMVPPELRDNSETPIAPEVEFRPPALRGQPDFIIATAKPQDLLNRARALVGLPAPPRFTATFDVAAARQGRPVKVHSGVGLKLVHSVEAAPAEWSVPLEPGTYVVASDGVERIFEVTGAEESVHVPL